jgi:hypothetical protein
MRALIAFAAVTLALPVQAQQPQRPPAPRPPAQAQAPQPPAPPPGFFPCRTESETCYIGVVSGANQVSVLFTNNGQAQGIEAKPIDVLSGEAGGAALDLNPHLGRVVMLIGIYDAKTGLTKAELVDVASPLVSFIVKQGAADESPSPPPPARGPQRPPRR